MAQPRGHREPEDTQTNGETDSWVGRDRGIATDRQTRQKQRWRAKSAGGRESRPEGWRDGTMGTLRVLQREPEMDRKRNRNEIEWEEADAERLRRTDRQRDEGRCKRHPTLTELLAGLLGPLRHLGKPCRAPGRKAGGHSKLWTSVLGCLPHLPFPFLAPSR